MPLRTNLHIFTLPDGSTRQSRVSILDLNKDKIERLVWTYILAETWAVWEYIYKNEDIKTSFVQKREGRLPATKSSLKANASSLPECSCRSGCISRLVRSDTSMEKMNKFGCNHVFLRVRKVTMREFKLYHWLAYSFYVIRVHNGGRRMLFVQNVNDWTFRNIPRLHNSYPGTTTQKNSVNCQAFKRNTRSLNKISLKVSSHGRFLMRYLSPI